MIKWFGYLWNRFQFFIMNLVTASKNTETQVLTSSGVDGAGGGLTISQNVQQGFWLHRPEGGCPAGTGQGYV